ncbi:MAG: phosphoenolpyruvate--protein phosphotransferase, partial [Erysipelotrichaceae bacterium]|nr:phosphoenolpyruvate--protein phosphotransferase [Erysipelotrichaceae bacterium]
MLKGIAASSGIAISKVYKLEEVEIVIPTETKTPAEEIAKLDSALAKTVSAIEKVKERAATNLSEEELAVFDAHLMMAKDPEFYDQIKAAIEAGSNAENAAKTVSDQMIAMFESMEDA